MPMTMAARLAGIRNCQAETPAARATTSSIFWLSCVSVIIAAKRQANGKALSRKIGAFRADNCSKASIEASDFSAALRNCSTKSTSTMNTSSDRIMLMTIFVKREAM